MVLTAKVDTMYRKGDLMQSGKLTSTLNTFNIDLHVSSVTQLRMLESFLHGGVIIEDHQCLVEDLQVEHGSVFGGVHPQQFLDFHASANLPDEIRNGADER